MKNAKKKNHKKLFLVLGGVFVIILIFVVVVVLLNSRNQKHTEASSFEKINQDFIAGMLSADEYVDYSLSALQGSDELPSQYRSRATDLFSTEAMIEFVEKNSSELRPETLQKLSETIGLVNIEFDMDASANASTKKRGGFPGLMTQNAYAESKKIKILNKVKLSNEGHFLVFYTDTGEDQISDDKADSILNMAEDIVAKYSSELGLEYKYKSTTIDSLKINSMRKLMNENGINDSMLDTAMPIYVINTNQKSENVIAYYLSKYGGRFLALTEIGSLSGVPSYPYVNLIRPNSSEADFRVTLAHELGHHYTSNYCHEKFGEKCATGDFISETLPNFFAMEVSKGLTKDNFLNNEHYELQYLGAGTGMKISEVLPNHAGYPALAFLVNYYENVSNGLNKMMESLGCFDALECLYDKAGESEFKKTMTALAERNITSSYDELPLGSLNFTKYDTSDCNKMCTRSVMVQPAVAEYVAFFTDLNDGSKLYVEARDNVAVSLIGFRPGEERRREVIYSGVTSNFSYDISEASGYEMLMVVGANYRIDNLGHFTARVVAKEYEEIVDASKGTGKDCKTSEVSSADEALDELEDTTDAIDMLFGESDFTAMIREIGDAMKENKDGKYISTTCQNNIKTGLGRDEVVSKIYSMLGGNVKHSESSFLFVNFDIFLKADRASQEWGLYILTEGFGKMQLMTMEINAE